MRAERCALLLFFWASTAWARIGHEHEEEQPQHTQPDERPRNRRIQKANGNKVKDQYMVRISKTSELAVVTDAIVFMNPFCSILYTYLHVFEGFCVTQIPEEFMEMFMVLNEFDIMEVEEDKEQATFQSAGEVEWGLDRIDQVSLPLDGTFRGRRAQSFTGSGVDIYVVDTGVLESHTEFEGRVRSGINFSFDDEITDGNGHGTHVAAIAAGKTYGVAPGANIVPVKAFDNRGFSSTASVIKALDWVTEQHRAGGSNKKSVANLSVGGEFSEALNSSVQAAVASGVVVVTASGNSNSDACNVSPAAEPAAITVGSTNRNDVRSDYSNYGTCLNIFAPGDDITSATSTSTTSTDTFSGTSMAAPHVSGAVALLLEADSFAFGSQARERLEAMAAQNQIQNVGAGSPNRFLYIGDILGSDDVPTNSNPAPSPATVPTNPIPAPSPATVPTSGYTTTITMRLKYDDYPHETSVKFFRVGEGGEYEEDSSWDPPAYSGYASGKADDLVVTLELSRGDYSFKFYDSWGDGICCEHGSGKYTIKDKNTGEVIQKGGDFESEVEVEFSV